MMQTADQVLNALLFGASFTFLLFIFVPGRTDRSRKQAAWIAVLAMALFSSAEAASSWDGLLFYLHMALVCAIAAFIMKLRTGWNWHAALQRAMSWYLVMDCGVLLLTHLSRKITDEDVFRSTPVWRMILFLILLTAVLSGAVLLLKRLFGNEIYADGKTVSLCLLSVIPYMYMRQITFWLPVGVNDVSAGTILTVLFCMLLASMITIILERLLRSEHDRRRALAEKMELEQQQERYIIRKSSMDTVRQQYHDMKNLLLYLKKAPGTENTQANVDQMLQSIRPFETILETGNEVFDILLGEKLKTCQDLGIPCTVMVDGSLFSSIDPMDLAAITGNAMDNALEACRQISEGRSIEVRSASKPGFVILRVRNSCNPELSVHGTIPRTTKEDTEDHGFGLGNIRKIMQKYNGDMYCEAENGEFALTLLFPM